MIGSSSRIGFLFVVLTVGCDGDAPKAAAESKAKAPTPTAKAEESKSAKESEAKEPDAKAADADAKAADADAKAEESPSDPKLSEARRLQFKDPAEAYRLAKESYEANQDLMSLWVMGPAACRMKDEDKAKWVHERLPKDDQTKFVEICKNKGVELKPDPT